MSCSVFKVRVSRYKGALITSEENSLHLAAGNAEVQVWVLFCCCTMQHRLQRYDAPTPQKKKQNWSRGLKCQQLDGN